MKADYRDYKEWMIPIPDDFAALKGIEKLIKNARFRLRDEKNRITWVYDRLRGLC